MKEIKTRPGKTYAVESAGEVIITNTETGAIAAQGDGSGQVLFTACANSYTVSDDAAKIVALFKLAPRLRLALLQGGAGGWLPKGFTELEYLESSGTQNICVQAPNLIETGETWNQEVDIQFLSNYRSLVGFMGRSGLFWGSSADGYFDISPPYIATNTPFMRDTVSFTTQFLRIDPTLSPPANAFFANKLNGTGWSLNKHTCNPGNLPESWLYGLFRYAEEHSNGDRGCIRIWSCKCWSDSVSYDLVPVLNADGEPGMWDKVGKQFYGNTGSGTFGYRIKRTGEEVAPMSLRDPWRVAPSGVYARKISETELEILADTEETTGDGWEWFANVADAYEHFGIVPEAEDEFLTE